MRGACCDYVQKSSSAAATFRRVKLKQSYCLYAASPFPVSAFFFFQGDGLSSTDCVLFAHYVDGPVIKVGINGFL